MARALISVLVLVAIAAGAYAARRGFIQAFFPDGSPGSAPELTAAPPGAQGIAAAGRVRVVLIDGLGADHAPRLPVLRRACSRGVELRSDNGFPTVSLPIQHVLWTGRTQQQSGVAYRVPALEQPPQDAIPMRVEGSIAVAESHVEIVRSFGFSEVREGDDFLTTAIQAVRSDARLVFVHVLRVDEAGHASGAASPQYADAASTADAVLDALIGSDHDPVDSLWLVLSDHGHLAGGGHGGSEHTIRVVQACLFGGKVPQQRFAEPPLVHLVDIHRALVDGLGLAPSGDAVGRPLAFAIEHPDPEATLPRPGALRWIIAAALVGFGAVVSARAAKGRAAGLPWWIAAAYACVVALHGFPTLSNPMVYPPWGLDVLLAGIPAALLLALSLYRAASTLVGQLAFPLGLGLGAFVLCAGRPPLMPVWTAQCSVLLTLLMLGFGVAAVTQLALVVNRRRDPDPDSATP